MSKVLIVIDAQRDFITGALGSEAANAAVPNICKLINEYMENNEKIILTMDTHFPGYLGTYEGKHLPIEHCMYDSKGWELDKRIGDMVMNYPNKILISKTTFGYTGWNNCELENYSDITICGFCSSICCMANTQIIHALYPETPIIFVENASAGLSEEDHQAACRIMKDCQIEVVSI